MAKSQNGYQAPPPKLRQFVVTDHTKLNIRDGSTGLILTHLSRRFDNNLEDIDFNYRNGELDDWGYAMRAIRGYEDDLSNHASGTAIDLNATDHPLGVDHTFTDKEERKIRHILKMYEGCVRWGGDYSGRVDPMHFEINAPIAKCEEVAKKLFETRNGKWLLERNPGLKAYVLS